MKSRDDIALEFALKLTNVYWSDLDEYNSASDLLKCMMESAYEHADAFIVEMNRKNLH